MRTRTTDTTTDEVARMLAAGMKQISSRELRELLDAIGYRIEPRHCFTYINTANAITYRAKSMGYKHVASGMRYAHIDAPKKTLPALREIRRNSFVFEGVRIWEL